MVASTVTSENCWSTSWEVTVSQCAGKRTYKFDAKSVVVKRFLMQCFPCNCSNSSEATNSSDIAVWNLETEDHSHVGRHAGVSHAGACVDLRFCLTASRHESMLRVWNLTSEVLRLVSHSAN